MKSFNFTQIETFLGEKFLVLGNKNDILFDNFAALNQSNETSLSWLRFKNLDINERINDTKAKVIICSLEEDIEKKSIENKAVFIKVKNPRLVFARIITGLLKKDIEPFVDKTSTIHIKATIGANVHIGPNCFIGNCNIGNNVKIYGNVYIFDNVTVGNNVTIMPNTTIGGVGFGYEKNEDNEFELFPHIGGVIIKDNVDIGANTCIDRGTLGNTIIGMGTKIDNLVHIAHNVEIGDNCAIIAHAMIGGSTVIKNNCWVAPTACIRDGITIEQNVVLGLGAVAIKSIPENEVWAGNPARKFK
jgi:UDP-3-O-[3-hydroxymyristoyl] glucosamine N-acyltransferase